MKRAKLLAYYWFSGCLATAHSLEEVFFVMASCYEIVDEEYIELKDNTENENTKNSTEW